MEEKLKQYAKVVTLCHKLAEIDAKTYAKAKPRNIDIKTWEHDLYSKHILNFVYFSQITDEVDVDLLKTILDS